MKVVVGLGNQGEKYSEVRHNLGWSVVDALVDRLQGTGDSWKYEEKFKSEILDFTLNASRLTLVKPLTYMNNSGLAVKLLTTYYKLPATDLIVIHDDLDLMLGQIKVRTGGSAAGHHGVESIISALGTDQFTRIRLGIGNQKSHLGEHQRVHFEAEKFVLKPFEPSEKPQVKHMIKQAVGALEILINEGLEKAQNQFN